MIKIIKYIIFGFCLFIFNACGPYSFTGASLDPAIKTVSIGNFPNHADIINPVLSQAFSEKLKDKFLRETQLNLIENNGDIDFTGSITNYSVSTAAVATGDRATQSRLTISVRVKFINKIDPAQDFEQSFSRYNDFDANLSLNQVEGQLVEEITEMLVQDIFNKAVINW